LQATDVTAGHEAGTKTQDAASESFRILDLAPELRNKIYEFAFTTPAETGEDIDLFTSLGSMPSTSLLLACRQIHYEATGIYKESCHRYWTTGNFIVNRDVADAEAVDLDLLPSMDRQLRSVPTAGLELISNLAVFRRSRGEWYKFTYDGNSVWTADEPTGRPAPNDREAKQYRVLTRNFVAESTSFQFLWQEVDEPVPAAHPVHGPWQPLLPLRETLYLLGSGSVLTEPF
jgi:hypothetical protein